MNSNDRVAVITGASRGLGEAIVRSLLEKGWKVCCLSRSSSPLIQEWLDRDPDGERFVWESIDVMDFQKVNRYVADAAKRFGRLDVLVNNAGAILEGLFSLARPSDIHRILALNVESVMNLTRTCSRIMLQQRFGNIISISSIDAVSGHRGVAVYSAAKAALDGMTRSLARELGPMGVRVNSIAPGFFESTMTQTLSKEQLAQIVRRTPLKRLGDVQDVANVVLFLISPDASFMTGQTLVVDGGLTC